MKMISIESTMASRQSIPLRKLRKRMQYVGGETAFVILEGDLAVSERVALLKLIKALQDEYVHVVVDITHVSVPRGATSILLELAHTKVQFIGGQGR